MKNKHIASKIYTTLVMLFYIFRFCTHYIFVQRGQNYCMERLFVQMV